MSGRPDPYWRMAMLLLGAFAAGALVATMLVTPHAREIARARKNGYADGLEACVGPSRLERAAKWVAQ